MSKRSVFHLSPQQFHRLLDLATGDPHIAPEGSSEPPGAVEPAGPSREALGSWIGRYRLVRVLGEGGMGMVYLAEQEAPIKRQVALKVIKPGMDSKRVIARFEAERQALALLDHPNIAHVYDAGTTDAGRPYFVMAYVEGLPITDYCDRHRLSVEDRLRLFQQVCLAVHHAHQKGIIHRDLKPSNVIVSADNDRPTPRIIDFGVVKAMSQPLTERTVFMEGSQLLGTPEYMSPEQADMAGEDIDTRSDIYSLGVLLYVLLAGMLPFDSDTLRTGGIEHIRQVIRETDPKTPSTRLGKLGGEASRLAENRRTRAAKLAKCLRRELEWIPLKAMRKERAERYRSASELADDIENYLKREPMIAGPPGAAYRLKKFVRRNRVWVGGIAAILVVFFAGVVISTVFAIGQARALAENQLVVDFLKNDVLGSASQASVGQATVSYLLDAGSKTLGDKFKGKPLLEAEICATLGWTYRQIGELDQAEQHLLKAVRIYQEHYGKAHPSTLGARNSLGWVYRDQGRYDEMEQLWTENLQIGQSVWPLIKQVHTMNHLGAAHLIRGEFEEAETLFEKIVDWDQRELQGEYTRSAPWLRGNLAAVYLCQGRYDAAEQLLIETIRTFESREDLAGNLLKLKRSLAVTYGQQGRYDEAESLFDETLKAFRLLRGDTHIETLHCMMYFAELHIEQEHYDEAEDLLNEALQTAREQSGKNRPFLLSLELALARLKTRQGQYDEAETLLSPVLKARQRDDEDHPATIKALNDFGVLRREQQRYEEAEFLLRQALDGRQHKLGPDHPACFESMHELAVLYLQQARHEDAEPLLLDAYRGRETKLGREHPYTIDSLKQLVTLYESWNKPDEAAKWRAKLAGRFAGASQE
ncbi:MAG: tetratricopeptide repeat protein [Sedimentisphaerales bacterium]|nr:tetratricopeptide repeat protein [Sedimentisphaerales bacterium]